ncbi:MULTISPECIES: hypothetical protein [Pseudomonas]|uniref:hypothetical protein n=1 Tax=Pseudomonas TaxID=286 RepID=UPI001C65F219|nr:MULTISPECIES: hypothetical protein [unclassified Pseudomonas]MBW8127515.1 hypothetical protein [Pseudomonas sp. LAP_36]MBW8139291.1 hypothetical protein [Pseudomonas sp. PAMC 26818]
MTENQTKQIEEIVQKSADDEGISFQDAFDIAIAILKLHALSSPSGEGRALDPRQIV